MRRRDHLQDLNAPKSKAIETITRKAVPQTTNTRDRFATLPTLNYAGIQTRRLARQVFTGRGIQATSSGVQIFLKPTEFQNLIAKMTRSILEQVRKPSPW